LDVSVNPATDQTVEFVTKNLPNLISLNIRGLKITDKSIQNLPQNLQILDIAANNLPATACKLLAEGYPQLLQVKTPTTCSNTEHLNTLKSVRPNLVVIEGTDVADCYQQDGWRPAVVLGETATAQLVHDYCGPNLTYAWFDKGTGFTVPFLSNKESYVRQDGVHAYKECHYCDVLHGVCKDFLFGGTLNWATRNDSHFQTERGIGELGFICDLVKTSGGVLESFYPSLSPGITQFTLFQNVLKAIPRSVTTMQCSTMSPEELSYLLSNAPSLKNLSLHGLFGDEHAKIVQKKPNLRSLSLTLCTITDEGLKSIASKLKDLISFSAKLCKNITDKGMALFLQANQKLENVEIDFQHQLTFRTISYLSKLNRLVSLTAAYNVHLQKSVGNAVNKLQVNKPTLKFTRSPFLVDGPNGSLCFVLDFSGPIGYTETQNQYKVHTWGADPEASTHPEDAISWLSESEISGLSLKPHEQHPRFVPDCTLCRPLYLAGNHILC